LSLITWSASFTFLAMQRFWPTPLSDDGEADDGEADDDAVDAVARRLSTRLRKR